MFLFVRYTLDFKLNTNVLVGFLSIMTVGLQFVMNFALVFHLHLFLFKLFIYVYTRYCMYIYAIIDFLNIKIIKRSCLSHEAIRGAAAQSVTVKPIGCGFDPHSRR